MPENLTTPFVQAEDEPKKREPWRRFFARELDSILYMILWYLFLILIMNQNIGKSSAVMQILTWFVTSLMMLFLEPLFLSCFAATPGKWILGLYVTHYSGRNMTYKEAFSRTWKMFVYGLGLRLPILTLVCQAASFLKSDAREPLRWEEEEGSLLSLKDQRRRRIFFYITAWIATLFCLLLAVLNAEMPKNRGEITVEQFCENYNRLAAYYDMGSEYTLDHDGNWIREPVDDNTVVLSVFGDFGPPSFHFIEEDGKMTGLEFSFRSPTENVHPSIYRKEMVLAILAFIKAQPSYNMFSGDMIGLSAQILNGYWESFSFSRHGVFVSCEVDVTESDSVENESSDTGYIYAFSFCMKKE